MADQAIGCMEACPDCCRVDVACLNPWSVKFVLLLGFDNRIFLVGSCCGLRIGSVEDGGSVPAAGSRRGRKKAKQ